MYAMDVALSLCRTRLPGPTGVFEDIIRCMKAEVIQSLKYLQLAVLIVSIYDSGTKIGRMKR